MRRLGIILPCIVFLFTACNEQLATDFTDSSQKGYVSFDLSADLRNENVSVKSSSADDISTDDFWVEIFSPSGTRIFCEKYADAKDTVLHVNSGNHRFLASYGDENGVGFDAPYYKADTTYTIGGQEEVQYIELKARLANVKVAVEFDEKLDDKLSYDDYYALVRNNGKKLRFNPGETRAGYIPAGTLEFILYVKMGGAWKQFVYTSEFKPNDFVTYSLDVTYGSDGDIVLVIKIDDSVDVQEVEVSIPSDEVLPVDAPVVTFSGFGSDGTLSFVEGYAPALNDVSFGIYAEGELESVTLGIVSEELAALGIPSSVELLGADAAVVAAMEEAGIWWSVSDDNRTMGISLTDAYADVISKASYNYDPLAGTCLPVAEFTLDVKSMRGFVDTAQEKVSVTVNHNAPSGTFSYNDYNVWATKVIDPVLTLTNAENYARVKVQSSLDGNSWSDFMDVTSPEFSMGEITGLQPGTTYHLRAMYDGQVLVAEPVAIRTEDAAQVGNAGFEEWTVEKYTYTQTGVGNGSRDWYLPWGSTSDTWWAVNSKKTMPSETTAAAQPYKVCPTVSFCTSDVSQGNRAAQIATVFVSSGATANTFAANWPWNYTSAAGELFIGTADAGGNHSSDGHTFSSRPSELSLKYKYDSLDGETFYAYVEVRNAADQVIASKEVTDGAETSSWKELSMPLNYTDTKTKAAYIYMTFKSTSSSSPSYDNDIALEMNGSTQRGHMGSVLTIDDLQLLYY